VQRINWFSLIDFLVEKNHDVFAIRSHAPSNISDESNFIYTDYQDFSEMQPYLNDKYASYQSCR
jgi:poly(3-hydroxyalkanoate) synthetase